MTVYQRLAKLYKESKRLPLNRDSKYVLMSDCHRGTGSGADNFAKNHNLYYAAVQHYDRNGFCYIELGDGDELWENRDFSGITEEYSHIFELLAKLYKEERLYMLYGNHDMVKKAPKWVRQNLRTRLEDNTNQPVSLFPGIRVEEGLVLRRGGTQGDILLIHGHQADFLNYDLWRLSKFLVRYVWRPLELIGIKDPFSATKHSKRLKVEEKLMGWAEQEKKILVAGHTHRWAFPKPGESLYFNDGCSVHPRHISAIEIENEKIALVKWEIATKDNGVLFVTRDVVHGPVDLDEYLV